MKRRWLAKQHSKDRENSVPSIGDRNPGNAVTREDSSQIADTVDDSGRRRAAFLTTELERDGSRQVGVGPDHQEPTSVTSATGKCREAWKLSWPRRKSTAPANNSP